MSNNSNSEKSGQNDHKISLNSKDEPLYVKVVEEESEEPVEIPVENDGFILLATLAAQFPGACGLKFRSSSGAFRGLRLDDAGKIHPPSDSEGFGDKTYVAVFPKENVKRKMDDHVDTSGATKLKRVEAKKCSDLIVLGLPFKTTEEELREYFEQFGAMLVSQIKRDLQTGKSKGFGFIRFADYDTQLKVMSQRHNIDGRMCDVRIPNSKLDAVNPSSHKVFVGRMTEDIENEDLRSHFSQFGNVTDVFVPKPFRSFAFVSFEDPAVAESLCGEEFVIKGCSVQVSPATPKESNRSSSSRSVRTADRRSGGYIPPYDDSRFKRSNVEPFLRHYDMVPDSSSFGDFYPNARQGSGYYGDGISDYDQRSYAGYKAQLSSSRSSMSGRVSPLSKMSRPQAWTPSGTGGYGMSSYGGRDRTGPSFVNEYVSPWESAPPSFRRSDTPSFVQSMPEVVTSAAKVGNSVGQQSSSATNQATAGISALNLNSLINPAVLAAAQACLLNQLAASSGTTDFSALLSNLQTAAAQNTPQNSSKGHPSDIGGFDGRNRMDD